MDSKSWMSFWACAFGGMVLALLLARALAIASRKKTKLPPGPRGWPVVGNLFQLGKKPNESLFHLAHKYGSLMTLRLGMKTVVVVSSPAIAKEVLKTNDQIFTGRIVIQAAKCLSYHETSLVWSQYGPRWRMLRRIFNTELFSTKRIESLQHLRRQQVQHMIRLVYQDCLQHTSVDIGQTVFLTSVNLIGNMMFSKNMFEPDSAAAEEFKDIIWRMMEFGGIPNLADFFPWLQWLDPQGVRRNVTKCIERIYGLFDEFIEDRLASRSQDSSISDRDKDFLDVLLEIRSSGHYSEDSQFTLQGIKSLLLDMFQAGTDVTATTIEWAMAELTHNPRTMRQAQAELDDVVGRHRKVEECDIERLPYLHAVLKEVFRLHPPAPLLTNRAESSCQIGGFFIPKHTQTIVNVWAIGRDSTIWRDPFEFSPERFLESEIDYRGQNFELIPFGAGRRICPALPLANRMLNVILASLLHSYDWSLPDGQSPHQMDITEKFGLTLQKAVPLKIIPTLRIPTTLLQRSPLPELL